MDDDERDPRGVLAEGQEQDEKAAVDVQAGERAT